MRKILALIVAILAVLSLTAQSASADTGIKFKHRGCSDANGYAYAADFDYFDVDEANGNVRTHPQYVIWNSTRGAFDRFEVEYQDYNGATHDVLIVGGSASTHNDVVYSDEYDFSGTTDYYGRNYRFRYWNSDGGGCSTGWRPLWTDGQ